MLAPIEWKQIAGYPAASFCVIHDRFVEPICVTDAQGVTQLVCSYCAEAIPLHKEAWKKEIERPRGFEAHGMYSTFWCRVTGCKFSTLSGQALDMHAKFAHGDKALRRTNKCKNCKAESAKDAVDFCSQCEEPTCNDHLDWQGMCSLCSSMWPYA